MWRTRKWHRSGRDSSRRGQLELLLAFPVNWNVGRSAHSTAPSPRPASSPDTDYPPAAACGDGSLPSRALSFHRWRPYEPQHFSYSGENNARGRWNQTAGVSKRMARQAEYRISRAGSGGINPPANICRDRDPSAPRHGWLISIHPPASRGLSDRRHHLCGHPPPKELGFTGAHDVICIFCHATRKRH